MNRYTYKAKRKDNNEWVYGYYTFHKYSNSHYIIGENFMDIEIEILPETLCQCTGLQDYYEHDLVKYENEETIYEIVWFDKECYFGLKAFNLSYGIREKEMLYYEDTFEYLKKVGNKFDKDGDK